MDDVVLESPTQASHPERVRGEHTVQSAVWSVGCLNHGLRHLAPVHCAVDRQQISRVEEVVLVDVGTVQKQNQGVRHRGVVTGGQVNVQVARHTQDRRENPSVASVILRMVDDAAGQAAAEAIEAREVEELGMRAFPVAAAITRRAAMLRLMIEVSRGTTIRLEPKIDRPGSAVDSPLSMRSRLELAWR